MIEIEQALGVSDTEILEVQKTMRVVFAYQLDEPGGR